MEKVKLQNEKKVITFFLIATIVIFIGSIIFLFASIKKDELGGSFISAMLLFISGYGSLVFVSKAVKYRFLTKLQTAILDDGILDFASLMEQFGKSEKKITKEVDFMLKNGYLAGMEIEDGRLIDPEAERIANEIMMQKLVERQMKKSQEQPVKEEKKKRKRVESEKCPNCGARVKFKEGSAECPYCGNSLNRV